MSSKPNSWSHDDFICYMMIYASAADGHMEDDELDHIKEVCGAKVFNRMWQAFNDASLAPIIEYKNAKKLDDNAIESALHDVMTVYMADGDFDEAELQQFGRLKEALS